MVAPARPGRASVAIDTGGTFTDVTVVDRDSGCIWAVKTPSTPEDPSLGFNEGIDLALARSGLAASDVSHVLHGTTVATNAILELKGAPSALLVTDGFRHVLEIARQEVPRRANMFAWVKPQRPVAADRIFQIPGRMDAAGREIAPLDEDAVRRAVDAARAEGIAAIAVCLLHAYANPAHEARVRAIIGEAFPEAMVSLSSDVLPVFREYERSMATVFNVYVMPIVVSYVRRLHERLHDRGIGARLLLMKSNGGVTGACNIEQQPVLTALSGPAAGVVGAVTVGGLSGHRNLISIDIGGTSADICLIRDGAPSVTTEGSVGDWPLQFPMIDINTIGAGGGSIARLTPSGALTVGPQSAGAQPGPVCYRRGGAEPTVTDAHLVLGHLPPYLLNGAFELDAAAAREAIERRIARPLGIDVYRAAAGILAIVDANMVGAIRTVSVERGHDPRDYALLPFGGAGPLHAASIARALGITTILVPSMPGVLSSIGLLVSDVRNDFLRTYPQSPPDYDLAGIAGVFAELTGRAQRWLDEENIPPEGRSLQWQAGLRYVHQGFELNVPWAGHEADAPSLGATIERFHALHERLYTFAQRDTGVELVTLRVDATGRLPKPSLARHPRGDAAVDTVVGRQALHIGGESRTTQCPIHDRARMVPGSTVEGPAVIAQFDCTTVILPGQHAEVDEYGTIVIRDR
jgi:N-methylhydantoinase A